MPRRHDNRSVLRARALDRICGTGPNILSCCDNISLAYRAVLWPGVVPESDSDHNRCSPVPGLPTMRTRDTALTILADHGDDHAERLHALCLGGE